MERHVDLLVIIFLIVVFFAVWALANRLALPIAYCQVIGVMTPSYAVSLLRISINGIDYVRVYRLSDH